MTQEEPTPIDPDFAGDAEGVSADAQFEDRFPIEKRPVARAAAALPAKRERAA
jgi:hypothetical protein